MGLGRLDIDNAMEMMGQVDIGHSIGNFNSPIFSTFVGYYVIRGLNIYITFPILLDHCFLAFYTTIAFKSYIPPTFS